MEIAKGNVQKHFPVVGVLELLHETLFVLERKMPKYFSGASQTLEKSFKDAYVFENEANANHKRPVEKYIRDMVQRNMTYEIEFYEFCKQRLLKQYKSIIKTK